MIGLIKGTARQAKSVSGLPLPIATYNGNLKAPIKKLSLSINPTQAGSGTPSPSNVRPISGFDNISVVRCGVNLWDEQWEVGYISVLDGRNSSSQVNIRSKNYIPIKPNVSLYLKANIAIVYCPIIFYDKDKNFLSSVAQTLWNRTITTPENAYYMRFYMHDSYGTTYNNDISINYPSSDIQYHAYNGNTYTFTFGQTVYGGVADVTNGKLTVTHGIVDLGTLNWIYRTSGSQLAPYFYVYFSGIKFRGEFAITKYNFLCPIYESVRREGSTFVDYKVCADGYASIVTQIQIKDSRYTDAVSFKTAMDGVHLVYELATPIEIQLTPQQINSFLGANNLWHDGNGDVEELVYQNRQLYYGR